MNKWNKGISMVSLIVVVVSIIILAGIAITSGYRYITETIESEKTALVNLISDGAYRRQNDLSVDSNKFYVGKLVKEEQITSEHFNNLPEDFDEAKTEINSKLNGVTPIWFVLDAESAKDLGVDGLKDYSKYIVDKFADIPTDEKYSPVAIVEYVTGTTFLVEMKNSFNSSLSSSSHNHVWSVATCTEPMKCTIEGCDETYGEALGHDWIPATCTQAKTCRRCGIKEGEALGHNFPDTYDYDAYKHWIKCLNGCGTYKENGEHTKNYISVDDTYHEERCYICGWTSARTKHALTIENVDATHHKRYCTLCEYGRESEIIHSDSGWKYNNREHWKECLICGEKILLGEHVDINNDLICDTCGKYLDYTAPKAFDDGDIQIITRTTHQLEIRAKTEDNDGGLGLDRYEFSIDDRSTWNSVSVANDSEPGIFKFENLTHNQDYTIYVKAFDKENNFVNGSITTSTYEVPSQYVQSEISPDPSTGTFVNTQATVTLTLPETSLPQVAINELKIVYKIEGEHDTWNEYTAPIVITRDEETIIDAKIIDKRVPIANSSTTVKRISINNIDKTAPVVTVNSSNIAQMVSVRITDAKAGIAQGTKIYYFWSDTDATPSAYSQYVEVPLAGNDVSVNVPLPTRVEGNFYLWIKSGVSDIVGNATTTDIRSSTSYYVDDIEPELIERTMRNKEADKIDELFVRTGKKITINMKSNRSLLKGPLVQIITAAGTKSARATSDDNINWVATITVDETLSEGLLNGVKFSDYTSMSGKAGVNYTTTTDGKYVTYDKTLPALEYVNK